MQSERELKEVEESLNEEKVEIEARKRFALEMRNYIMGQIKAGDKPLFILGDLKAQLNNIIAS